MCRARTVARHNPCITYQRSILFPIPLGCGFLCFSGYCGCIWCCRAKRLCVDIVARKMSSARNESSNMLKRTAGGSHTNGANLNLIDAYSKLQPWICACVCSKHVIKLKLACSKWESVFSPLFWSNFSFLRFFFSYLPLELWTAIELQLLIRFDWSFVPTNLRRAHNKIPLEWGSCYIISSSLVCAERINETHSALSVYGNANLLGERHEKLWIGRCRESHCVNGDRFDRISDCKIVDKWKRTDEIDDHG